MKNRLWNVDGYQADKRGSQIAAALEELDLPEDFSILEAACGYGNVLNDIVANFPDCKPLGTDLVSYDEWDLMDVPLEVKPLQDLIKKNQKWDVVVMLNSYRNWEGELKEQFDAWLTKNATYFISSGDNHPDWPYQEIGLDTHNITLKLFTV